MAETSVGHSEDAGTPLIVVVSGPSGVGKDALLERMAELGHRDRHQFLVTATTRPARAGEEDGVNHHFVSGDRFQEMIDGGELLEWATIWGNLYGMPRQQTRDALARGMHVLARVDVQGAARLRKLVPEAVFVFVLPPSMEALRERLLQRAQDSDESIARRLAGAQEEIDQAGEFDFRLVNEDGRLDETVAKLVEIIERESHRDPPRRIVV